MILARQVGLHETHIGCQSFEQRTGKRAAQHGDAHIGILAGQRADDRNHHGHIAQGREPDDKYMLGLHEDYFL